MLLRDLQAHEGLGNHLVLQFLGLRVEEVVVAGVEHVQHVVRRGHKLTRFLVDDGQKFEGLQVERLVLDVVRQP